MDPNLARTAYTVSIIFLILALIALPFNMGVEPGFAIDLVVIVMLVFFIIYVVLKARSGDP